LGQSTDPFFLTRETFPVGIASPIDSSGADFLERLLSEVASLSARAVESFPVVAGAGASVDAALADESEFTEAVSPAIAASANSTQEANRSSGFFSKARATAAAVSAGTAFLTSFSSGSTRLV
jgi:hypothetical protein